MVPHDVVPHGGQDVSVIYNFRISSSLVFVSL